MKILAIDIGAGTEDILLYDKSKTIENCIKMVLPCPSLVFSSKVRRITQLGKDILIEGEIIGGGAFSSALKAHLARGYRVLMSRETAYTIRNDLEEVRQLGIEIFDEESEPIHFSGETLKINEVNIQELRRFFTNFGEEFSDVEVVSIAVQDHGIPPKGLSNRKFRFEEIRKVLKRDRKLENLAFIEDETPSYFLRMRSAVKSAKRQLPEAKVVVMDTCPAAILGCLEDPLVKAVDPVLAINVGNAHTMATIVSRGNVEGIMEHHTRLLNPAKIERFLKDFANGKLTDDKIFIDGGHGLFLLSDPPKFSEIGIVAATGPNRKLLSKTKLKVHYANPAGDVMMTGPVGLIEAVKKKLRIKGK